MTDIKLSWQGGMAFASQIRGHGLTLDTIRDEGGADQGPRPMETVLAALGTCLGMDFLLVIERMRLQPPAALSLSLNAERLSGSPSPFASIHIDLTVACDAATDRLNHALQVAKRQCSVLASLNCPVAVDLAVVAN